VVACASGVHVHELPEQVLVGALHVLGQVTDVPQLFVPGPQILPAQVVASASGVQLQALPAHLFGALQVSGQVTAVPQLLTAGPHALPAHVVARLSATQAQALPEHLFGALQVSGHVTCAPQLLVAGPQAFPAQVTARLSHPQGFVPALSAAPSQSLSAFERQSRARAVTAPTHAVGHLPAVQVCTPRLQMPTFAAGPHGRCCPSTHGQPSLGTPLHVASSALVHASAGAGTMLHAVHCPDAHFCKPLAQLPSAPAQGRV